MTVSTVPVAAPPAVDAGRGVLLRGTAPRSAGAGGFVLRLAPLDRSAALRVAVGADVSPSIRVAVQPIVAVRRRRAALTVSVRPASSAVARLERRERGRWRRVGARRLAGGRTAFALPAAGDYRVAVAPAAGLAGRVPRVVRLP